MALTHFRPGKNITQGPDHTCDCFAALGFCKEGETPVYKAPTDRCPTCWPKEDTSCMCFAALGFCGDTTKAAV